MSKLFILGAGFSKAVSDKMPTMKELGTFVRDRIPELPGDPQVYYRLMSDPSNVEELLTYLYQEMPWKTVEQALIEKAAFHKLSAYIVEHIAGFESELYQSQTQIPSWAKDFVSYLHTQKATVATFNYDTILEGLSTLYIRPFPNSPGLAIGISNYYDMPIHHVANRGESSRAFATNPERPETYRLIKLHGSINWYFPGSETAPDQPIYYSDESLPVRHDASELEDIRRNKAGLKPLIIPPITEKTPFYGIRLLRSLWLDLYNSLVESDEVYFTGYSLPKTDITTRILLSTSANSQSKRIYIVNLKEGLDELVRNYQQTLPDCELITDYISDCNAIEAMVRDLVN
jgi:hypothetical protein